MRFAAVIDSFNFIEITVICLKSEMLHQSSRTVVIVIIDTTRDQNLGS